MTEEQQTTQVFGDQLRAKIGSKFQTSTFLAGLAFNVLGTQLTSLKENAPLSPWLVLSIALMFAAVILYVAAAIKLDELTMPKRFWEIRPDPNRSVPSPLEAGLLEDDDLWELKELMVLYWYRLTLRAAKITGLALLLLIIPRGWICIDMSPAWALAAVIASIAVTFVYFWTFTQKLEKRPHKLARLID